jgi:hypothetical protein
MSQQSCEREQLLPQRHGLGKLYHGPYGTSVTGAAAVSTPDAPVSAGQGLVGGVRNTVPRIIGCNIAVN